MSTPEVPMSDEPYPDAVTDDLAYLGSVLTAQRGRTVIVNAMLPSGPAYPRPHVSILHTQDADGNADLLVLKRYRDPRALQDEKRALEWARQSGTPVPVVVAAETSGNSPIGTSFVLMTHVNGRRDARARRREDR
ncbi:MAG: phosphotransferase [Armatimonadia bacterium]